LDREAGDCQSPAPLVQKYFEGRQLIGEKLVAFGKTILKSKAGYDLGWVF